MKRSKIDSLIREAIERCSRQGIHLPPFAYWSAQDWQHRGREYDEIRTNMLGWDVTDYGRGDFESVGLLLFTLRNGSLTQPAYHKPYAEKMLISRVGQLSPNHFHHRKMEDIINRGGGILCIRLWNADERDELAQSPVRIRLDGRCMEIPAGDTVRLVPGESITLCPRQYHLFWAENDTVTAWEVSMTNDDNTDNRFYEPQARFTSIEEDVPAQYLLCNEYPSSR